MRVAEQRRTPGAHQVDEFGAVGIHDERSVRGREEARGSADRAEGAHGRVDPAGENAARTVEQLLGARRLAGGHFAHSASSSAQ